MVLNWAMSKTKTGSKALTALQQKFVECYNGNATESARLAGYQGTDNTLGQQGFQNLKIPKIAEAIQARQKPVLKKLIATRADRQAFWTEMMNNMENSPQDRMRASELLGKSEADFLNKVEVSGKVTLEDLVQGSRDVTRSHKDEND